jgi:hypothetical protein
MKSLHCRLFGLSRWQHSILLTIAALCTNQAALAQPSIDFLAEQILRLQDSVASNPPSGDLTPPPEARLSAAPATRLLDLVERIDVLKKRISPSAYISVNVPNALAAARIAYEAYGLGDLDKVFENLKEAAIHLQPSGVAAKDPSIEVLKELRRGIAFIAASVAERVRTVVDAAGVVPTAAETQLNNGARLLLLSGNYVGAIGQFWGGMSFAADTITFDIDLFEQNIRDALRGKIIGYAYTIGRDGVSFTEDGPGSARTYPDSPRADQSPYKEMFIASMSKTISALALLKALSDAGISVDDKIDTFLPGDWVPGDGVENLTFRHLLTHTSGLDPSKLSKGGKDGQSFDTLKTIIEQGTPGILAFEEAVYTNANFSLLRILIPRVALGAGVIDNYTNILPPDEVDEMYAVLYADYVVNEVLAPAGIDVPDCSPRDDAGSRTLYYNFDSPNNPGGDFGNWSLECGAVGWYLSSNELGSLLAHVRYTNEILDEQTRATMNDGALGWLNPIVYADWVDGVFGIYHAGAGDISDMSKRGMIGCMMNYPIRVEATLVINSRSSDLDKGGDACVILKEAYDNAWTQH